jgi:hypothetical protein
MNIFEFFLGFKYISISDEIKLIFLFELMTGFNGTDFFLFKKLRKFCT